MDDSCADFASALINAFAKPAGQPLRPQSLFVVAAQIFLEGNIFKPLKPFAQGMLLICLPKETGIVEAGAQDTFVSVANDALRIAVGV